MNEYAADEEWVQYPHRPIAEAYNTCYELVLAAGCICGRSGDNPDVDDWINGLDAVEFYPAAVDEPLRVKIHNPRCPQALAAAIKARMHAPVEANDEEP